MKKIKLITLGIFLIIIVLISLYKFNLYNRTNLIILYDKVKINFNIKSSYKKRITIEKKYVIKDKTVVFFERFHKDNIKRNSNAELSAYLMKKTQNQKNDNSVYVFIANGDIFKLEKNLSEFFIERVENNLRKIVRTNDFFLPNPIDRHGIKDASIHNGEVYISYTDRLEDCGFLSIARSKLLNSGILNFEKIFETECLNLNLGQASKNAGHMAGGRLIPLDDNLYFSTGMLNNFLVPQDDSSSFGKILEIKNTNKKQSVKHIVKGIRNPQGLSKCGENIFVSSHGPKGGDEINHISLLYDKIPVNFGWPIASYGTHYDGTFGENAPSYAPLYQDHKKFNFKDPLLFYTPSVAPSQLIALPADNLDCKNGIILYMATMGWKDTPGQKSIHRYKLSFNGEKLIIKNKTIYNLGVRIRDIEEGENVIWFWDETNGRLGFIEK